MDVKFSHASPLHPPPPLTALRQNVVVKLPQRSSKATMPAMSAGELKLETNSTLFLPTVAFTHTTARVTPEADPHRSSSHQTYVTSPFLFMPCSISTCGDITSFYKTKNPMLAGCTYSLSMTSPHSSKQKNTKFC